MLQKFLNLWAWSLNAIGRQFRPVDLLQTFLSTLATTIRTAAGVAPFNMVRLTMGRLFGPSPTVSNACFTLQYAFSEVFGCTHESN